MSSIWTLVVTTYGGHDRDVHVRAYRTPAAIEPALRRALHDNSYVDDFGRDPTDPALGFDDLMAIAAETAPYDQMVEVFETTLYETAEAEAAERALW